ncbi:MAG: dihydropteroate synthase [Tepidisphaeraceae bacterium]
MSPSDFETWLKNPARPPLVMGVLNVTPDSFSDGGKYVSVEGAVWAAEEMVRQGASLIDVGGESTRPGAEPVSVDEQIRRVVPVIEAIRHLPIVVSVDTTSAQVAAAALDAGVGLLNDISAGQFDPGYLPLAASRQVPAVLMHMQGDPKTMQVAPTYSDVVEDVRRFLLERAKTALDAGVARHRILLDVGIGFGKTVEHNLRLLRELSVYRLDRFSLLMGTSRKGFIGKVTGVERAEDRVHGTMATVAWGVANGASIVRVHDVGPAVQTIRMIRAIQTTPTSNRK